jgi:hypothetical protein
MTPKRKRAQKPKSRKTRDETVELPASGGASAARDDLRPLDEDDVAADLENDELATELATTSIREMTGEDDAALFEQRDQIVPEDIGGPFEITSASDEFADDDPGVDDTWTKEPFPRTRGE